ncbi:BON domain-containing protein [Oleiagrimonas sp.]|jgi:hyperosmotically inducible protein|uniref:BON domain-containing protein n=1 Tax=Oleiagrimonas sp. TaxID=2010330 RepID=UPI00262C103F|nr:BON domain-containing protein [Oleiagrimonas sp.]MDA3913319.1 BON domain-containing protein [Oleiagrimonas sp.]
MKTRTLHKTRIVTGLVAALGMSAGPVLAHTAATPLVRVGMSTQADPSMGQKISDTWITTKVKSEFATTKGVSFTDISVDTRDGVVMLNGTVASQAGKTLAIRTARHVEGVKAVQADTLKVVRGEDQAADTKDGTSMGQKVSDTWITTKVKSEFATTKGVSMTDVSVDTKAGVVMLTGTVHSQAEKELAIRAARSVKGVKAVEAGHLDVGIRRLIPGTKGKPLRPLVPEDASRGPRGHL